MSLGLLFLLMDPEDVRRRQEAIKARYERLIEVSPAVDWTESFPAPAQPVVFEASTWEPFTLFDEPTDSPCGTWRYDTIPLKRAHPLDVKTYRGHKKIVFNDDVPIPRVLDVQKNTMWMSYTPQEVLTQRPGLRKTKGHTVVAGLGMGWLLTRVLQKKTVKKVTLVEQSQELVDWLLPVLRKRYDAPWDALEVVVGNAYDEVPKLTADVALWDIWEMLGTADNWECERVQAQCPNIGATWFWGASNWRD